MVHTEVHNSSGHAFGVVIRVRDSDGLVRVRRVKAPHVRDVWATQACAKVLPPLHPPRLLLSIQDVCRS